MDDLRDSLLESSDNLYKQDSVLINGKAYKEDIELNNFLNANGINLDNDTLKFDIYNSITIKTFDIIESRIKVETNNFLQNIDPEKIVPGSLNVLLILVNENQEQRELVLGDFDLTTRQTLLAEGNLNLIEKNNHPLKPGEYVMFIKVEWKTKMKEELTDVLVPLGQDIKKYLT